MAGRCLTSVYWGMAADKYGRVPIMLTGVISVFVLHFSFIFGVRHAIFTGHLRNVSGFASIFWESV